MSKWSHAFNSMPDDVRHIAAMVELEMRIKQIKLDRDKAKRHYMALIRDMNAQISNLERELNNSAKME